MGTGQSTQAWNREEPGGVRVPGVAGHGMEVADGMVFRFGGWNGKESSNEMFAYNDAKKAWGVVNPKGKRPAPRAHGGFVRYKNKLYSFGGFDEKNSRYFNDVHCFDIGCKRMHGKMYIFGGRDQDTNFSELYSLDLDDHVWVLLKAANDSPLQIPRPSAGATIAVDPRTHSIFMFGGYDGKKWYSNLFHFSIDTNIWTKLPRDKSFPLKPRVGHVLGYHDGAVYVLGGFDGKKRHRKVVRYCLGCFALRYMTVRHQWMFCESQEGLKRCLPYAVTGHKLCLWVNQETLDGRVFLHGGTVAKKAYSDIMFTFDLPPRLENDELLNRIRNQETKEIEWSVSTVTPSVSQSTPPLPEFDKVEGDVSETSTAEQAEQEESACETCRALKKANKDLRAELDAVVKEKLEWEEKYRQLKGKVDMLSATV